MTCTPRAVLLHGFLGVGKTTLAKRLELEERALRFTHDEWMSRLYGEDPPEEQFQDQARRVSAVMETIWTRCLELGLSVVLDFGFWSHQERDRTRALVAAHGGTAVLYRLECPDSVACRRIAERNGGLNGNLYIAPETFQALRRRFEPLEPDEERVEIRI